MAFTQRKPKIGNINSTIVADQQISGLDIAMNHPRFVDVVQRIGDRDQDFY